MVEALSLPSSREGVQLSLDHMMEVLRLGREDRVRFRHLIPFYMLRLDEDQDCYNFIHWWLTTGKSPSYDWKDDTAPYLDHVDVDAFEPVNRFCTPDIDIDFVVATTLLKVKLSIDLKNLRTSQELKSKLPLEIVHLVRDSIPRSNIILSCSKKMHQANYDLDIAKLDKQIDVLVEMGQKVNPFIWRAYMRAYHHDTTEYPTSISSSQHMREAKKVLEYSLPTWKETDGAIDYIASRYKTEWDSD